MSKEEFSKLLTRKPLIGEDFIKVFGESKRLLALEDEEEISSSTNSNAFAPLDWTKFTTPIKDQGNCGSCWAFGATGALEGNQAKKYNTTPVSLSPQHLVDCDTSDDGCDGGLGLDTYPWVQQNGVMTDADYPYTARKGDCKNVSTKAHTFITGFSYCSNYTSNKCNNNLIYSLLQQGLLLVGIDGSAIQSYKSGVFTGTCRADNHAVVALGNGVENGREYWLVRNSWGASWGEKGYIKVAFNDANKFSCYVANEGLFSIMK